MKKAFVFIIVSALLTCAAMFAGKETLASSPAIEFGPEAKKTLENLVLKPDEDKPTEPDPRVDEKILSVAGLNKVQGKVKKGESLAGMLNRAGANPAQSLEFARALKQVFDPRKVAVGDRYETVIDGDGRIFFFELRRSKTEVYRCEADGDGWNVCRVDVKVERVPTELAGRISSSLWASFVQAGGDADLVLSFADLFSWDVDFSHDTRPGDEFRLVYEKLYVDGEPIGNGRILAASYKDTDHLHTAIFFDKGNTQGYFSPDGKSVRKSFLRSPLKFSRISSGFSYSRLHPVLKIRRPHTGIDYAAPRGTPVWSVADGTVVRAYRSKQGGKTVHIKHTRGYETYYLHLSRYGKGVRSGKRVKQGQIIGYVGATGLATGPHLDYRVKKNGKWVNPLKEKYVPGEPVPKTEMEDFREVAAVWEARLEGILPAFDVAREN